MVNVMRQPPFLHPRPRVGGRTFLQAICIAVVALGCEDAEAPVGPSPERLTPAVATAAATALVFKQVSAGASHTCGLTTVGKAYCWGYGGSGQLGAGAMESSFTPVAVKGGLTFRQISAQSASTCGITTDFRAYCWGGNQYGQLGDGTTTPHSKPAPVAGGLAFRQIDAGYHVCAVTTDNRAYCWGRNFRGELGDGTTTQRSTPRAVRGGLLFSQVSQGGLFSCGITTIGAAYCWGTNSLGQLGDSTKVAQRLVPGPVAGAHQFRNLSAGGSHTCGVTTDFHAYCWGDGRVGALGTGKTYLSFWPRAVAAGLSFERVSAGETHSCGETTGNLAYCWGENEHSQLGDGVPNPFNEPRFSAKPVAVAGGLKFSQVSSGIRFTCGLTTTGAAYCWGDNLYGQHGDGTWGFDHPSPTPVAGPV